MFHHPQCPPVTIRAALNHMPPEDTPYPPVPTVRYVILAKSPARELVLMTPLDAPLSATANGPVSGLATVTGSTPRALIYGDSEGETLQVGRCTS